MHTQRAAGRALSGCQLMLAATAGAVCRAPPFARGLLPGAPSGARAWPSLLSGSSPHSSSSSPARHWQARAAPGARLIAWSAVRRAQARLPWRSASDAEADTQSPPSRSPCVCAWIWPWVGSPEYHGHAPHALYRPASHLHSRVPVNLHAHAYGHQMSGTLILDCIRPKRIRGLSLISILP